MKKLALILLTFLSNEWLAREAGGPGKDTCGIIVPNVVTMNCKGDDTFRVKTLCAVSSFTFKVFDRWGNKLFEQDTLKKYNAINWDYQKLPVGVYVWMIRYSLVNDTAKRTLTGHVTHIR